MNGFSVLLSHVVGRVVRHRYFLVVFVLNLVMIAVVLPKGPERGADAYRPAWESVHFLWIMVLFVVGAGILDKDFSNGFAFLTLTKPVSRYAYVLAKTAALAVVGAVGVGGSAALILGNALLRGDLAGFRHGILVALLLFLDLALWAACLVGLSGLVPGIGNSLCFYGLLVAGAFLSSADLGPWMIKPVLVLGELIRPPSVTELRGAGLLYVPRWVAVLHVIVYPAILIAWGGKRVLRKDLLRIRG